MRRGGMTPGPQAEVIAFLADPSTHGLPAAEVPHIRTHISEIFFAGERVYKVKRAVRYSFVNFTALEDRHAACLAEIGLNRRTAPDIYLGVAAVRRRPDGGLALDGLDRPAPGEAIEWAVVMTRFDEELVFDRLAGRGALEARWIAPLVDAVVGLHEVAEVGGAPFGGAEGLRRLIAENAADMATQLGALDPRSVAALNGRLEEGLGRHTAYLDARRARGFVRRCHGDLHLANVVLWKGRPTLFDCIEFSEAIAVIDVAYDFAFLLMDLLVHGLDEFANQALSRYVGRTGDAGATRVLPLMLALRASVRAKVNALALGGTAGGDARAELTAAARRYLAAAQAFIAPAPPPHLVAFGGLSGSGKTTLARMLGPGLGRAPGALHLRSDYIRKRLHHVLPEERLPREAYTREANTRVYETLLAEAEEGLRAGQWVIADAVFARPGEREAIEAAASRAGVPFHGVWLEAPAEVMSARVETRTGDASDATAEVVALQTRYDTGEIAWSRFANSGGPEAVVAELRAHLAP
jgi:hypothetical protein